MKIIALDGFTINPGDNPWDEIAALGELVVHDRLSEVQVIEHALDAEIIIANKTPVRRNTIERLGNLKNISITATGFNMVDVAYARTRNIPVSNVPEYGTMNVAQHTIALLMELCHRVGRHDADVKAGGWIAAKDWSYRLSGQVELAGLTMGIVGWGRIGRQVAKVASALGMKVIATSRTPSTKDGVELVELEELFRCADVISLHAPLTESTRHLVNRERLSQMKPTAFLINTSRGLLIDEAALAIALNTGRIAGAAVDVISEEPMIANNPLKDAKSIIFTPHIAWASLSARKRLMKATAENIRAFLAGTPINVVN